MLTHPDQQVQELLNMIEGQRDTAMIECANLRIANKNLASDLEVAKKATPEDPISPAAT